MALVAYRLAFRGPIHLGTGREGDLADLDVLPRSDTIASAIVALWRHIASGASDQEASRIAAQPPFAVSSAMPAVLAGGKWETLLFLPPGIFDRVPRLSGAERKSLKRVRFASIESLRSLLNGRIPPGVATRGDALVPANFDGELWTNRSRLRLHVDRMGDRPMDGQLYEFGGIHLANNVCLTVIIDFIDASCRSNVEAALALLGDEGIGADRTAGYGSFVVDNVEEGFVADLGTGARLSLSLLHPTRDEIERGLLDPPAEYLITSRGGWATSTSASSFRRKIVNMLAEGSLVNDLGSQRYG
ncbi:MAG: type III-A CRISPR-associated RAMP protein Csm4, partial [Deltaproteobacteria bacterium]|nr:type III-A CRISPR-associated RAMP protein Csm4 [Deltaproteobacteria bacterium]